MIDKAGKWRRRCALAVISGLLAACQTPVNSTGGASKDTDQRPASGGDGRSSPGQLPYTRTNQDASRTPSEKQLKEDSENFRNVVFGGFVKAALTQGPIAAAACYVSFSKDVKARNQCIAASLVIISLKGAGEGYAVAKKQEAGQNQVRAMQAVTADMARDNARLQKLIDNAEAVLADSQARLTKLRSDAQAKRITLDQAKAESRREQENLDNMNKALLDAKTTRDEYVNASRSIQVSSQERRNIDAEITAMTSKVNALERDTKKLSDALVPFAA